MTVLAKRVGLYGGTFDPVHFGHLNLAIQIKERYLLDAVWFCPANLSPGRDDHEAAPAPHRLKMVELAVAPIEGVAVLDLEVKRSGPSYTIDTVRALLLNRTFEELFLIMSDEVAGTVGSWKEADALLELAPPLIGRRTLEPQLPTSLQGSYTPTAVYEITATDVRTRLKQGLYCGHLAPQRVLDYVSEHRLYR